MTDPILRALREIADGVSVTCWLCMDTHHCYVCSGIGSLPIWDATLRRPRAGGGMTICWRCEGTKTCRACAATPETDKAV